MEEDQQNKTIKETYLREIKKAFNYSDSQIKIVEFALEFLGQDSAIHMQRYMAFLCDEHNVSFKELTKTIVNDLKERF